jgi:cell division protein FtsI/penicillin-binding protein 2
MLSKALASAVRDDRYPTEATLNLDEQPTPVVVQWAFDAQLQDTMEKLIRRYRPDYGAFVAVDASTGRVLSMVSYIDHDKKIDENLALRATFPSASVFKVVTAAAAIEKRNYSPDTIIPFNGRPHTLYKHNIVKTKFTRWTRYITLKDAFAQSVNTVFGKIGALSLGAEELKDYADRFGFNHEIPSDVPIQPGRAPVQDDVWALAETASGFTRDNTMSPLQGALIAATIVNDGRMMEPYAVQSVHAQDGTPLYVAQPTVASNAVDRKTARVMRALMRQTVIRGTSRRSFRGFFRGEMADLDVGGKTGSLTGEDPRGKYDWFVGYGDDGTHRVAFAALTVHQRLWRVKSSYLGRKAIETFFREQLNDDMFEEHDPESLVKNGRDTRLASSGDKSTK